MYRAFFRDFQQALALRFIQVPNQFQFPGDVIEHSIGVRTIPAIVGMYFLML